MTAYNVIASVLFFIVAPYMAGSTICRIFKTSRGVCKSYVIGMATMFFLCGIVAVPIIVFELSYLIIENIVPTFMLAIVFFGIYKGYFKFKRKVLWRYIKIKFKNVSKPVFASYCCICAPAILFIISSLKLSYKHAYIARIAECVSDIINTNRIYMVDPATGLKLNDSFLGTKTFATSPFIVFVTFCSRMTSIHPSVILHTILPVVLVVFAFSFICVIVKLVLKNHFIIGGFAVLVMSLILMVFGWLRGYKVGRLEVAENNYKISNKTIDVCKGILDNDKQSWCILPAEFLSEARQYSSDMRLLYGMDGSGNLVYSTNEPCESIYENMESDNPDYNLIFETALVESCNVVVLDSDKIVDDSILDKYGYNPIKEVDGYIIYYNTFYNWKVTQHGNDDGSQSTFYTIESPSGGLTIIDGGWDSQYEAVWNVIEEYGYHVDNWIISHPHFDHVGAFNHIMNDSDLSSKITIDQIYVTPVNEERYEETAKEYDVYEDYLVYKDILDGLANVLYVNEGEEYYVDGLKMIIISAWDENVDSLPDHLCNDGSLMFKLSGCKESMLFCSDVQSEMEQFILPEHEEDIKVKYVQCGHHGNWGLTTDFYEMVNPNVAFMDAPPSLFETRDDIYDGYKTMDFFMEKGTTVYTFDGAPNVITLE